MTEICRDGDHQYVTNRDWERNLCAHCGQPEPPLSELLGTETVLVGDGSGEACRPVDPARYPPGATPLDSHVHVPGGVCPQCEMNVLRS